MSTLIMSQCWPLTGMTITQKAVLMALADYADDRTGQCWPTIAMIADRICGSDRAVQCALRWLEANRAILITRAPGRMAIYTLSPVRYRSEAYQA